MEDNTQHVWERRSVRIAVYTLAALLVALLVFHLGMLFEAGRLGHESRFGRVPPGSYAFGMGMPISLPHTFMEGGQGAVGTITGVSSTTLTLMTRANETETITIGTSTMVRGPIASSTLKTGESVVVLGKPDARGHVIAQFIRIIAPGPGAPPPGGR